jgi:hypothetical protein
LKYGGQRDAAALAVAGLISVRHTHDEIEIGYDADPVDVTWLVQNALDRNALVAQLGAEQLAPGMAPKPLRDAMVQVTSG